MALWHPEATRGLVGFITRVGGRDPRNDRVGPFEFLLGRMPVCGLFTVCVLLLITEVAEMWR